MNRTSLAVLTRSTLLAVGTGALLSGCSQPEKLSPVEWWHSLEGGKIAEQRPPPPLITAPYPNLSTVPDRPPAPNAAARAAVGGGLVADRTNAQYAAGLTPLPAVPTAPPRPAAVAPAPSGDDALGASLPAASAPKPPAQPVDGPMTALKRAPTQAVQTAALPASAAQPPPSPSAAPPPPPAPTAGEPPKAADAIPAAPPLATPAPATPPPAAPAAIKPTPPAFATPAAPLDTLPPIPAGPPPPPVLAGLPTITAPTPPPVAPPPPPPPIAAAAEGAPILVPFAPGSSTLPVEALASLKLLSRQRGSGAIVVTGYGDATSSDAAAQASAVPLALARARSIASNLLATGVPSSAIRITGEAQGRGGAAAIRN